jgi:hypothetical protein
MDRHEWHTLFNLLAFGDGRIRTLHLTWVVYRGVTRPL